MRVWMTPILNALKTDDAAILQQTFHSLSHHLEMMGTEIDRLKMAVEKSNQKDYQRIK